MLRLYLINFLENITKTASRILFPLELSCTLFDEDDTEHTKAEVIVVLVQLRKKEKRELSMVNNYSICQSVGWHFMVYSRLSISCDFEDLICFYRLQKESNRT